MVLLSTEIYTGIALAQYTPCLFLDIKRAFDNILPNILFQILRDLKIPESICKFVYNLISSRLLYFNIDRELSSPYLTHKGVPQESVLSPLLFKLYINKLREETTNNCKILQFADDTVIFTGGFDSEEILHNLSLAATNISNYLENIDLEISPSKSSLVIFTRKRIDPASCTMIEVKREFINSVDHTKFLDIYLDYHLTGHLHVKYLFSKGSKLLNILKMLRVVRCVVGLSSYVTSHHIQNGHKSLS